MPQFSDDLFLGPAETYMGTGLRNYSTTATGGTGGSSSSTLTVTAVGFGAPITVGMFVDGTSVTDEVVDLHDDGKGKDPPGIGK